MAAGPGDLERRQNHVRRLHRPCSCDLELRQRGAVLADEHHVHRQPPAPLRHEPFLARREDLALRLPDGEVLEKDPEALGVDPNAVAHRLELELALHRPCVVEATVPRDDLGRALERAVIADRHHVVEAVDADALPLDAVREPVAGPVDEELLADPGRAVLADVGRLAREDDRRLALERQQHVRVAVHDHEARHVGDRALEAGVLVAGDDHGVEPVPRHGLADQAVPPLDLLGGNAARRHCAHDASTPFTSAQIASCPGVGTPCFRPKPAMPPFR